MWSWRNHPIQGILFDVDGTLYRQGPVRRAMLVRLLTRHLTSPWRGLKTVRLLRAYRAAQENMRGSDHVPADLGAAHLEKACGGRPPDGSASLIERWMELEPLDVIARSRYDGLLEFCAEARASQVRLGVFSDYPPRRKLESLGMAKYCDTVVCAQDPDVCRFKPHPVGLTVSASRMQLRPEQVAYIGDRPGVDGEAAARAGMPCFILTRSKPSAHQAWTAFRDYPQLLAMLQDPDQ